MRRFMITVNGKTYDVGVEEVTGQSPAPAAAPVAQAPVAASAPAQAPAEAPKPAPAPAATLPAGGTRITAPMPGKIVSVKASAGQAVKRGDVLMVLEAMKMENEIQSPVDGTVAAIAVSTGAMVEAGAPLASIS